MKQRRRSPFEILVRLIVLLLGLFILAQGIAFTVLANLGTDAITSPALVAHLVLGDTEAGAGFAFCTLGRMLICVHVLLVLMQILVLRRKYRPIQLLQVVMGVLLGLLLDVCLNYTSLLPLPNYGASIAYTLLGCTICAFGIFTYVKADMVPLSAEGLSLALSSVYQWRFSRVKVAVDCSLLFIAVVASLILQGEIAGVREGSIICAVCTGYIIGWFFKVCPIWDRLFAAVGGCSDSASNLA
ncbi:MAG: hypothetical protein IKZ13_07565 [Akkermansia sp.]|nr:hypothetical protein [Akkermansia sp.]